MAVMVNSIPKDLSPLAIGSRGRPGRASGFILVIIRQRLHFVKDRMGLVRRSKRSCGRRGKRADSGVRGIWIGRVGFARLNT